MTDKSCSRCGACCMVLPLFTQHMHPDYRKYLLARGLVEDKEQGCILIPHQCQHLRKSVDDFIERQLLGWDGKYNCAIHDDPDRPEICRKFHGQRIMKHARVYIPLGCSYREG